MSDVLGAVEHPEGQGVEEVPGGEVAGDGTQLESGLLLQEVAHVLQLGDVVLAAR